MPFPDRAGGDVLDLADCAFVGADGAFGPAQGLAAELGHDARRKAESRVDDCFGVGGDRHLAVAAPGAPAAEPAEEVRVRGRGCCERDLGARSEIGYAHRLTEITTDPSGNAGHPSRT